MRIACRFALLFAALVPAAHAADELVVYSERREPLIQPIFEAYTRDTGIKVTWLNDAAPVLIERIAAEGAATRADLFMAVDAGNLWQAAERGILAAVHIAPAVGVPERGGAAHRRAEQGDALATARGEPGAHGGDVLEVARQRQLAHRPLRLAVATEVEGEQTGEATRCDVSRTPSSAKRSRFGVRISRAPKTPTSA